MNSVLVGYVRRSNNGGALKVNVSAEAFAKCERYKSREGDEFVGLVISLDNVGEVIDGDREVTSLCQISDSVAEVE